MVWPHLRYEHTMLYYTILYLAHVHVHVLHVSMNMLLLCLFYHLLDGDKTSQFEMKLMDIDSEHLGIPVSYVININTYNVFQKRKNMLITYNTTKHASVLENWVLNIHVYVYSTPNCPETCKCIRELGVEYMYMYMYITLFEYCYHNHLNISILFLTFLYIMIILHVGQNIKLSILNKYHDLILLTKLALEGIDSPI